MSDRPLRICDECGQVDDHPRHLVGFAPDTLPVNQEHITNVLAMDLPDDVKAKIVVDIADTSTQYRHMDCCRAAGCPTGECNALPDLKGEALLAHITGA